MHLRTCLPWSSFGNNYSTVHGKYPWTLVILPHFAHFHKDNMHIFIQITCRRRHRLPLAPNSWLSSFACVLHTYFMTQWQVQFAEWRQGIFKVINQLQGKRCKSNVMIYKTETLRPTNKTKDIKSTWKIEKRGAFSFREIPLFQLVTTTSFPSLPSAILHVCKAPYCIL